MSWLFPIPLYAEFLPQLLGVLGLLMTWELHDIELRAGRIKPRGSRAIRQWVQSHGGVRMYLIATPIDQNTCEICRHARGKVLSSAERNRKDFRPMGTVCMNPAGCRCELIGLIGNWPAAERLAKILQESKEQPILSESEMIALAASAGSLPSGPDRLALYLLEALHSEGINPNFAMSRYRSLICQALEGVQHPYIVAAYLRLSDLLERSGNLTAALTIVDEFLTVAKAGLGAHPPTRFQAKLMTIRRWRLLKLLKTQ